MNGVIQSAILQIRTDEDFFILKFHVDISGGVVGDGKVVIGRITLEALDGAFLFADDKNMIDRRFERRIVIFRLISPWKTIVIADCFVSLFCCDVVSVNESAIEGLFNRL